MSMYSANATHLKRGSKGHKMLKYIVEHGGATKYTLLTKALGVKGSKQGLRGYYSAYMRGWVDSDVVSYDPSTYMYYITPKGAWLFSQIIFNK